MTFKELEEEVKEMKIKAEMTDWRLEQLEKDYARLEREVFNLANKLRWELQ